MRIFLVVAAIAFALSGCGPPSSPSPVEPEFGECSASDFSAEYCTRLYHLGASDVPGEGGMVHLELELLSPLSATFTSARFELIVNAGQSIPGARAVATAGIATARSVTEPMGGEHDNHAELALAIDGSECVDPARCLIDIVVYLEALPPTDVSIPIHVGGMVTTDFTEVHDFVDYRDAMILREVSP